MVPSTETLPLLISVPHAGLSVPPEVETIFRLTHAQVVADGDEGAAEIYAVLRPNVQRFVTTSVARAVVDLNRAPDDRRLDGVIKTHTCWMEPVYLEAPDEATVARLLARYHAPYHESLTRLADSGVIAGIDCHTMAEFAPPVAPKPGEKRPWVCLSNGDGATCPGGWFERLGECLADAFDGNVSLNDPFKGGYIVRSHASEMPWIQLELSRADFMENVEKGERVLRALRIWDLSIAGEKSNEIKSRATNSWLM